MRSRMSRCLLIVACLVAVDAEQWTVAEYPDPTSSVGAQRCGRGNVLGAICDPDAFITPQSADVVEGHIKQIASAEYPYGSSGCREQGAEHSPGFQVAVALASSVEKESGESAANAAERFANGLFDSWGVGDGQCGNGVLLFVAFDDRQVFIATGHEISKYASDESLANVIDNMRLRLKSGAFSEAIEQAVIDTGLVLAGADPSPGHHEESRVDWGAMALIGIVASFFGFAAWGGWRAERSKRQALTLLEKLQREQETARLTGKYPAASCPICFEDLKPIQKKQIDEEGKEANPLAPPADETLLTSHSASDHGAKQPLLSRRKSREKNAELAQEQQQQDEASSSTLDEDSKDERKSPLCLPCGHTFCTDCISEWLQRNRNCPVCREDVYPGDAGPAPQRQMVTRDDPMHNRDLYNQEMEYRMRGLHRRYPTYITTSAVERAINHSRGDWVDFSSMRNEMMQPAVRTTYQDSGRQGSSQGFGGGSHSSHGVGGSW